MAEPLRHRQTKEAATDMFSLQPPRHISSLTVGELHHFTSCLLERTRSDSLGIRIHAYEFAPNCYYMPPRSPAALP